MKNLILAITLASILLGAGYKVWAMEQAVNENTDWRLLDQYQNVLDNIEGVVIECGEKAKNCSERRQRNYRTWRQRQKELEKKLGYSVEE